MWVLQWMLLGDASPSAYNGPWAGLVMGGAILLTLLVTGAASLAKGSSKRSSQNLPKGQA